MTEKKAKSVIKKATVGKTGSVAAARPRTAKAATTVAARKPTAKKSAAPAVKTAAASVAEKKPLEKKVPVKKTAEKKPAAKLTAEERYRMVQTAAYFIAERNGFGGCAIEHWAAAEREIAGKLC